MTYLKFRRFLLLLFFRFVKIKDFYEIYCIFDFFFIFANAFKVKLHIQYMYNPIYLLLFYSVVVLNCYHWKLTNHPLPPWFAYLFMDFFPRFLKIKKPFSNRRLLMERENSVIFCCCFCNHSAKIVLYRNCFPRAQTVVFDSRPYFVLFSTSIAFLR